MEVIEHDTNPFVPEMRFRPKLHKRSDEILRTLTQRYGSEHDIFWEPKYDDIGPVRVIFYRELLWPTPFQTFPFGTELYIPEIRYVYGSFGKAALNRDDWRENDIFLTCRLQKVGAQWRPLENAMLNAFWETSELKYTNKPDVLEAHVTNVARAAMFRGDDNSRSIRLYAESASATYRRERSQMAPMDSIVLLQWRWLREDFWKQKPFAAPQLLKYNSLDKSPFVTPVTQAAAKSLFHQLDPNRDNPNLPQDLRRILDTKCHYNPSAKIIGTGYVRKQFWQLLAAILNHLAPVIFGVPLSKPAELEFEDVKRRCGRDNEKIAKVLSGR